MTLSRSIPLTLAALFAAMLLTLAMLGVTTVVFARETRQVERAQAVKEALEEVRASFRAAEADARGYLLTGNEELADQARTETRQARVGADAVARLTAGRATQEANVQALRAALDGKLSIVEQLLDDRRTAPELASRDVAAGRRSTAALDAVLDRMGRDEKDLLAARRASVAATGRQLILTGVLLTAVFAVASWRFERHLRRTFDERERAYGDLLAAEQDREALVARLRRSNAELEEFAMVASHDLQEPLRKIQVFGERLDQDFADALGPTGRDYVRRMQTAGSRGQSLVLGLLAYSRVTTKAQPFVPVDLGRVVREVESDLEARLESVDGRLEIGPLPTIEADPLQIRQLVQNLVGNSLKFHRPDEPPLVRIRAERFERDGTAGWTVAFEDNGIGFDQKYADRIFKLFQRLHERGVYEGSGMGLAICRKIAERHGGSIRVKSTAGVGSQFMVDLPDHRRPSAESCS